MSKYQTRLNREELEAQLAAARAPDERRRVQVLLYLAGGVPLSDIAGMTGYRPRSIRQIAQRYLEIGADSLVDQRAFAQGAAPILSAEEQIELCNALQSVPPDGGAWTGGKVAQWMAAKTGKPVHRQRGCEYLRRFWTSTGREGDERSVER
ncbi:MAG TPA: helix-turn-helix domain-containing protein [Roseiflexaceae bacterium]|nr:helix-turn-helix domain-containing protein [Roseiflexaceae bacterium]